MVEVRAKQSKPTDFEQGVLLPLRKQAPIRVVCIGGGTGLPLVLRGLARRVGRQHDQPRLQITAIVAMSDDGGSSGRLRRSRGSLPPGDVRNCLVALASGRSELSQLLQYRFDGAKGLAGHAVGNLLIAALAELKGDFLEAVNVTANLLNARGRVLPCTTAPVELSAELADNTEVLGERNIRRSGAKIVRVHLNPRHPPAAEGILDAIAEADLISIGPGSLYSSILPNLLVAGIAPALRQTRALRVLIANLMSEPGETDQMDCGAHVRAVLDHAGPILDAVLINAAPISEALLEKYAKRNSFPVAADREQLLRLGVMPIEANLLRRGVRIRHDSRRVARSLLRLVRSRLLRQAS
jgi:uncharacterized cofD-like protein